MVDPADIPADYYLSHFRVLFDLVWEHDRELFTPAERGVLRRFVRLGRDAQLLLVRLLSRRPAVPLASLHYAEVQDVSAALEELRSAGLVEVGPPVAKRLGPLPCLQRYPVARLREAARAEGLPDVGRKPDLVERLASSPAALDALLAHEPLACVVHRPLFQRMTVLFFGNRWQDLSTFVVELLEHARYADYEVIRAPPRFGTREDLERYLHWGVWAEIELGDVKDQALREVADQATLDARGPFVELVAAAGFRCARELERRGDRLGALSSYASLSSCSAAPEPASKAIDRLGLLGGRAGDPGSFAIARRLAGSEGWDAASRFRIESRAHRLGLASDPRDVLRLPRTISLHLRRRPDLHGRQAWGPADAETAVEAATLVALRQPGLHCENTIVRALFALLFWDVVFAPVPGAFIQPFQSAPLDFSSAAFFPRRAEAIGARLHELSRADLAAEATRAWVSHHGEACAWVAWSRWTLPTLATAAAALGPRLLPVLEWIAHHPARHARGFPDLLLWDAEHIRDSARFVEVKAPGDQLRLEQHLAHDTLLRAGYPVAVAKIIEAG